MTAPDGTAVGDIFGRNVRDVRERRQWTQADLAERVKALGGSLETKAVASIEAAKRRVSVDEALQLAIALDVSPLHLMIPRSADAVVLLSPRYSVTAQEARAWIRAREPLPDMDERTFWTEVPDEEWDRTAGDLRRFRWAFAEGATAGLEEVAEAVRMIGEAAERCADASRSSFECLFASLSEDGHSARGFGTTIDGVSP